MRSQALVATLSTPTGGTGPTGTDSVSPLGPDLPGLGAPSGLVGLVGLIGRGLVGDWAGLGLGVRRGVAMTQVGLPVLLLHLRYREPQQMAPSERWLQASARDAGTHRCV